jgi:hypothetical protein
MQEESIAIFWIIEKNLKSQAHVCQQIKLLKNSEYGLEAVKAIRDEKVIWLSYIVRKTVRFKWAI